MMYNDLFFEDHLFEKTVYDTSDGETFEVDVEIAKCSVTIKTMLEDLGKL